tara:strand:+ start:238 stop:471 length:234 start_codon:yes stop_codon:yes gene_type:complete
MDPILSLIPITKIKISKENWLELPIKYDDELKIKDIIEEMCERTYSWIMNKGDLEVVTDYDSFKEDFINLLYDKYLK